MRDVTKAAIVFVAVVALAIVVRECKAGEWFGEGHVYIGVQDLTNLGGGTVNAFCFDDSNEIGVLGLTTEVWGSGRHSVIGSLDHQSCLQEDDDESSANWIGIKYRYQLW